MIQICCLFDGRPYTRLVSPQEAVDFDSGRCEAYKWFEKKKVKSTDYKKKGIVLFRNFWGAGNQGDHLDLWNGAVMTRGGPSYFAKSKEVWFWELK